MTAKSAKELSVLGVLLLVLGGVLYVNYFAPAATPAANKVPASNQTARDVPPPSTSPLVTEVKLDLLDAAPEADPPARRDLFRFKEKPAPVVRAPVVPVAPVRPVTTTQTEKPQAEILIRYVGYTVNAAGATVVSLTVRPDNKAMAIPWVGVEGDVIEGRYRLQRVTPDAVEIVELGNDRRRSRIPRS
jgi:hypothetical protein